MSSGPQCWRAQYKSYSVGTLLLPMSCRCRTRAKVYSAEAGFQRRLPTLDTVLFDSVCLVAIWHLTQKICLCAMEFVAIWDRKVGRMEGLHGWSPCRRRACGCSHRRQITLLASGPEQKDRGYGCQALHSRLPHVDRWCGISSRH